MATTTVPPGIGRAVARTSPYPGTEMLWDERSSGTAASAATASGSRVLRLTRSSSSSPPTTMPLAAPRSGAATMSVPSAAPRPGGWLCAIASAEWSRFCRTSPSSWSLR